MKYEDANEYLNRGKTVESNVSKTIYQLNEGVLMADGFSVSDDFMTKEEIEGDWIEVMLIERTIEEVTAMSESEINTIFEHATASFVFNAKNGRL